MPAPLFDLLLVAHVVSAVIGFGSIGVSALMAWRGRVSGDPAREAQVVRFFGATSPAGDWPSRLVYAVPVLGAALLVGPRGGHGFAGEPWPWCGLALWLAAVGVLTARMWPAEREARAALSALRSGDGPLAAFQSACRRMERAAEIVSLCAVAALVVMVLQPG